MADFHVLDVEEKKGAARVAFHFPVASVNNAAGVNYRTALVQYLGGASAIVSSTATGAELTQLQAGEIIERVETVRFSSINLTDAQRLAELRAAWAALNARVIAELQERLTFWGYAGVRA